MRRLASMLSVSLLLMGGLAKAQQSPEPPVVALEKGKVSGVWKDGAAAFLGIPYAAPPTGENRWRAPKPVAAWQGTRPANQFGPSCPQRIVPSLGPWTHEYLPSGATSEDCLTLNVWKPAKGGRNLPVLVWIHGGGFTSGSASVPVYDGAALAQKGLVVVSINYRIGFLGSLASPEFREAGGGNFGVQDQIAALQWVKRNISAFGGDPQRVTIAGQSAGAFSVHYLILAPGARGLFQQAIPQSGTGLGTGYDLWLDSRENAERSASALLEAAGVASVAEARKLSYEQLAVAYIKAGGLPGSARGFKTKPYADGVVLPLDPGAAFKAGHYNDTPVLIGLTADEGSGLNPSYRLTDPAKYEQWLHGAYGPLAADLAKIYPAGSQRSPVPAVIRDAGIASTIAWAAERGRTSRFPLYGYVWTHVEPGPDAARYGAFHTSEVPYVFGTLSKAPERNFSAEDGQISATMQDYWVNFVKTGDPNAKNLPHWDPFGRQGRMMELGGRFAPYPALPPEAERLFTEHVAQGGTLFGS